MTTTIDLSESRSAFRTALVSLGLKPADATRAADLFAAVVPRTLTTLAADLTAELEKVRGQYADTRRHNDLLTAELADQQRANTAHANENQRLRDVIEAVEGYVGEHGEGEVDVWSLRELLAGRPTLEYPQGVAR